MTSPPRRQQGYTLLEVLVAMVLVAVVTLVATLALRLALRAWERARQEGEVGVLAVTLPLLLQRQLETVVSRADFAGAGGRPRSLALPFQGEATALSFFTAYAPQGAGAGGLWRVAYVFRPREKSLWLYLLPVTRREQAVVAGHRPATNLVDNQEPVSRLEGVESLAFAYQRRGSDDWRETAPVAPAVVRLQLQGSGGRRAVSWEFPVNGAGR